MAWQRLARTGIRAVMAIIRHTLAPDGDHTRAAVRRDHVNLLADSLDVLHADFL